MDLALNNLQRLICHKTQQTNQTIHLNNNVTKLKILEDLYKKFRQPGMYRINFETSDDILEYLK